MTSSLLHRTESQPSRASELTFVLLGLLSCGRNMETLVERTAPAPAEPPPPAAAGAPDTFVAQVLGLLRLSRQLGDRLDALLPSAASLAAPAPPPATSGSLRGALR